MFSIYIVILYLALFAYKPTRKIALVLTPWAIFGCSYDCMRLLPNYEVNPIDIRELYETEKKWFGIVTAAGTVTPNEFFCTSPPRCRRPLGRLFLSLLGACAHWIQHISIYKR